MIITIDGPAGSGKSTAARGLAKKLGVSFLDTGATYRCVTLKAMRENADLTDSAELVKIAGDIDVSMSADGDGVKVMLDGQDVSQAIRAEEVSANTRYAANCGEVRGLLVDMQRKLGGDLGDFVTEGRDQGSVVFTDADVKIYLDASPAERAKRRMLELEGRGAKADYDEVLKGIEARDANDRGRAVGPLCIPDDAVIIDSTGKGIDDIQQEMFDIVRAKV